MTKARVLGIASLALMCLCLAIGLVGAILGVFLGEDPTCHATAFGLFMAFLALLQVEIVLDFAAKKAKDQTD